jgi:protein-disulfide isomerase
MKRLFLAALLVTGCRPSDGGSQTTPSSASGTASPAPRAATDSARIDSLLGRFQCPFCKRWHDEVYPTIKREYIDPGHVRMAYVHLPLSSIHPHALPAAEASLCASVQGRFWPMHDKLFDTQPMWAKLPNAARVFDSLATSVGVDMAKFSECMSSHVMRRVVNGDMARATSAGAHSTPVFFVGDEPIQGLAPIDVFRGAIARARAKAGRRPPQ